MSDQLMLVNDGSINIDSLIREKIIFFGERHAHIGDTTFVKKIIEITEPDFVLVEGLADLKLETRLDKLKANKMKVEDLYYQGLTKWWIDIALESDIPFIGFELTTNSKISDMDLKDSFKAREDHWIEVIKKYTTGNNHVLIVCGDTHLRTIKTKELGDKSPLYKKFPKAVFIRLENPECE